MNKQETAKWLANYLLDWETETHPIGLIWITPCTQHRSMKLKDLVEYFYSPEGFFAVWNAVEKLPEVTFTQFINEPEYRVYIDTHDGTQIEGNGKDRYEAFYNAVMEAMKNE